jgi:hypothetical protein
MGPIDTMNDIRAQREKAQYAEANQAVKGSGSPSANYYSDASPATAGLGGVPRRPSLIERLEFRSRELYEKNDLVNQAHALLTAHPEFEAYIQLQDLINNGVLY